MKALETVRHLYCHVPFCAHKCDYCAFYSHRPAGELVDRYVDALVRELELVQPELEPKTIFFGGGTPSLLTLLQWNKVFAAMARLNLAGVKEWTVECNPATVSADKARLLREAGVNRISMGVQSLSAPLLERLGRVHSRDMVFRSYDILRKAGFENINLDLMFGIPGQTISIWRETLGEILAMNPEHISSYEVIYEEDTPLFEQLQAGAFSVDEDLVCDMYDELLATVEGGGYQQYEIANFSRRAGADGGELSCAHNINYWRGGSFHGLGPSAAGYIDGVRTKNWSNTTLYCEQLEKGKRAIESTEKLSSLGRAGEIAAFGLRMNAGWPRTEFHARTGYDLAVEWKPEIERLLSLGYGEFNSERLRLTRTGLRYADWVAEQFLRN